MKNELSRTSYDQICWSKTKNLYSYLIDGTSEDEREKNKKQFLTKRKPKFKLFRSKST